MDLTPDPSTRRPRPTVAPWFTAPPVEPPSTPAPAPVDWYTEADVQSMLAFGITPSEHILAAQRHINDERRRAVDLSRVSSLTYGGAVSEAHEALTGLLADMTGTTPRKGLKEMVTHENRLRGLGVLLITLAMVGLVVDYILITYP